MERIVKRGEIIRDSWALLSVSRRETTLRGVVKMDKKKKKKEKKSLDVWSKIRQTTVSLFFTSVRRVCQSGGCTSAIKFFSNRHSFTSARRDERWQLPKCLIVSIEFRPREISRPITATRNRSLGHCESQRVEMKFLSLGTVNGETGPQKLSHFTPIRLLLH